MFVRNVGYYLTKLYSWHLRTKEPSVTTRKTSSTVKLVSLQATFAPTVFVIGVVGGADPESVYILFLILKIML